MRPALSGCSFAPRQVDCPGFQAFTPSGKHSAWIISEATIVNIRNRTLINFADIQRIDWEFAFQAVA
jgi:hypothetical protein